MTTLTPVAAWIRVSTEGQAAEGKAGIPRQQSSINLAAERHGLRIVSTFTLEGVSGSVTGSTPEWSEVRRMLDRGTIRGVVCDAVDRLCRASDLDLTVLSDLQRAGASVYTPTEVRALSSSSDGLIAGILALVAGQEKREIARRMHAGREINRKRGRWAQDPERLPPGLSFDKVTGEWSTTPEIDHVRRIFKRIADGKASMHKVAIDEGVNRRTLKDRLLNPLYRGFLIHEHTNIYTPDGRRKRVKRDPSDVIRVRVFDEPPVPDAITSAVDARLTSNRRVYATRGRIAADDVHVFRGLLHCADCGSPMTTIRRAQGYGYKCASSARVHRKEEPGKRVQDCRAGHLPMDAVHVAAHPH